MFTSNCLILKNQFLVMGLLVFYFFLALIVSFLCSVMEAVLLSTPLPYLKVREEEGHLWASKFIRYKMNIDKPLSAILSLNTIANTIGAAGVGAQAIIVFGDFYFGIASAVLTFSILIFSEIIPKTMGAVYWRKLAAAAGKLIPVTIYITWPLGKISIWITRFISGKHRRQTTSREEFSALAHIGTHEGILIEKENILIQNIMKLKSLKTSEIMTPRVVVAAANEEMSLEEFVRNRDFLRFSRIPVYKNSIENITGYILRQHVFEKIADNASGLKLKDFRREIAVVHEATPILSAWETLLEQKEYIALVIDEYGGMAGIITMEDVVESVLGFEIIDEKDTISDMQEYARQRWKMKQAKFNYLDNLKNND